ncbi:hypothetical protein BS17DRAFT_812129 [Gyrodon lividus]|nr:hypothetical protein BS17DRAFT_812129 [Gyrodon lividus]
MSTPSASQLSSAPSTHLSSSSSSVPPSFQLAVMQPPPSSSSALAASPLATHTCALVGDSSGTTLPSHAYPPSSHRQPPHLCNKAWLHAKQHLELQKSTGGHPSNLSPANVWHAIHLISTHKAENAVQITKTLTNIINQPLHPNTVCPALKKTGLKAVVKQKCPLLSNKHCKAWLDYAYAHKGWTVED